MEYSAYAVIGKQGEVIFENFLVSSRNEDDRATFEAIRKKLENTKKDFKKRS